MSMNDKFMFLINYFMRDIRENYDDNDNNDWV